MAKKILIVEDDKMLLTIFQMFVQELGYDVAATARTGQDAISAAMENKDISCVLMDIMLDGELDGVATASKLREILDAPVIMTTGISSPEIIQNAVMDNVYGFMAKPLYKQNLGMSIEYACAKYALDHSRK